MIAAVIRKELRDQRPFAVLAVVILVLDLLSELVSVAPDLRPLSAVWQSLTGTDGLDPLLLILAFALGSGLLVRELDERTIELLDSLPVRRWHLFAVKVGVALATLMVVPIGETLEALAFQVFSRTSLDHGFHLALLGGWLALVCAQLFIALSVALLLSFLRRLGWLILGVLACLMLAMRDHHPLWRMFDPTQLLAPHFAGQHWMFPARVLAVQLPVAVVALGMALMLFSGAADRLFERTGKRLGRGWIKGLLAVGIVGTLAWGSYLISRDVKPDQAATHPDHPFTFETTQLGHAQTRHYLFSFRASQQARAEALIARADATFDQVAGFLGVSQSPVIAVDLTGAPKHLLGVTHTRAIRMSLVGSSQKELVSTLAHETTHALARELAQGGDQRATLDEMRAFDEGLASYVEHRFFAPGRVDPARFWVAALRERDQLHFMRMIEGQEFLEAHDPTMVYPVGERLIAQVVARYGEAGPGRLLQAMGRKDPPKDLRGLKLWLDTFQAAQMDLPLLVDDLSREATRLAAERRLQLDAIPRPRAYLASDQAGDPEVRTVLDTPLPSGFEVVCRFRAEQSAHFENLDDADEEDGAFPVPPEDIVAGRVWVQVGVHELSSGHALYEPWVQLTVP